MTSVEAEFTAFATARTPALYRSAWMLCGDRHTAEDLVQETLGKVYVAWRRSIENPAAYAQTTLVRTFISRRRQRSSGELAYADLPDAPGDDPSSGADLRMQLQEALGSLAPLDRAVVVLRYLTVGVDAVEEGPSVVMLNRGRGEVRERDRDRGRRGVAVVDRADRWAQARLASHLIRRDYHRDARPFAPRTR